MSKAPVDIIKYIIHVDAEASGLVEKPDLIGAIFGQTEGLLGEDLDLRELQKSGRIGRIDATIATKGGITNAEVTIPSSLDMVETSIIAAGVETISRIGPCDAKFKIQKVEDVREDKRKAVVDRAREILKTFMTEGVQNTKDISEGIREDIRTANITKYQGLDAGPGVDEGDSIIIVEGRADVLNLLRNGIKNGIAVGGIKIPKEIVGITKDKSATLFVDGDRGGELILKSLKSAGAKIDFVAIAPAGREVEGLARKEVIMTLRRKKTFDEAMSELEGSDKGDRDKRKSRESNDKRSSSRGKTDRRDSGPKKRESSSDRRDSRSRRSGGDRRAPSRSRDSGDEYKRRPSGPRERRTISVPEVSVSNSENDKLLEKLEGLKNQAILLDDKLEEIKKVELESLKKEKGLKKAHALIVDDIVTKDILELGKNCKYIVGITTAGNLSIPEDKKIITKF